MDDHHHDLLGSSSNDAGDDGSQVSLPSAGRMADDGRSMIQLSSSNTVDFHSLARQLRHLESDRIDVLSLYHLCLDYNEAHEVIAQLYRFREVCMDDCGGDSEYVMMENIFQHPSIHRIEYACSQEDGPSDMIMSAMSKGFQSIAHGLKELCLRVSMTPSFTQALLSDGINQSLSTQNWEGIPLLKILDLSQCEFTSPDSIAVLCNGLQENVGLTDLKLESCHLEDDELSNIVDSIKQHPTLRRLSLALNYAGSDTIEAVSRLMLSQKRSTASSESSGILEHLNLGQQSPGHLRNMHLLYQAIEYNTVFKSLYLCENYLLRSQLPHLIHSLAANNALEELNLEDCDLRKEGVEMLLNNLSTFAFLRKLWLRKNVSPLSEASVDLTKILIKEMKRNHVLQLLDIDEEWVPRGKDRVQIDNYLLLNQAGRRFIKSRIDKDRLPLGMWPVLIERVQLQVSSKLDEQASSRHKNCSSKVGYFCFHTVVFFLLQGPAMSEVIL
jgi:hypothetical protein